MTSCTASDLRATCPALLARALPESEREVYIVSTHLRGDDGMCTGCRLWWALLVPYPCWQVQWATSKQARSVTAHFLGCPG